MCPDWESNQWPFGSQASAQSTKPHQLECIFIVMGFCMFCWDNKSSFELDPEGSLLGRILEDWETYSCNLTSKTLLFKQTMIYYCNTVWSTYVLTGEKRPVNGSLSSCIIKQLKRYCRQWETRRNSAISMHLYHCIITFYWRQRIVWWCRKKGGLKTPPW